jgi:invasion protein IalB
MMNRRILTIAAVALMGTASLAAAQQATTVDTFRDWSVHVSNPPEGKVCFISSQPQDSKYSQTIRGRDSAFFQVTSIPARNIRNQASTIIGFTFKENSDVVIDIDGNTFRMYTDAAQADGAWAVPETEPALIEAMKGGTRMSLVSTSSRDTVVTDAYSLLGITAALDKMTAECP